MTDLRPLLRRLIAAVARGGCEDDIALIHEAQLMLIKLDREEKPK